MITPKNIFYLDHYYDHIIGSIEESSKIYFSPYFEITGNYPAQLYYYPDTSFQFPIYSSPSAG